MAQQVAFGQPMRDQFLFAKDWKNLNHGSFGTYPRPVRNVLHQLQETCESTPDKFIKYTSIELLDQAREEVAQVLNAPVDECAFVANATTGVNIVLRNLHWKEKDVILYFSFVYEACEFTLFSVQEMHPQLNLHKVEITLPASHADICTAFSQAISRVLYDGFNPKLALFDSIASLPGVRVPFERLVKICKEYNILSLMDAAHAIGQIPLNLTELDPDFFVSNCHKWLYTPRGCAVFFVPKRNQHLIRTALPTSWGYKPLSRVSKPAPGLAPFTKSDFISTFQFVATADVSPYFCVPVARTFRQDVCGGDEAIYAYIRKIAQEGADRLAAILGTKVMDDREPGREGPDQWSGSLRDCAMANVLLPIQIEGIDIPGLPSSAVTVTQDHLQKHLSWMLTTLVSEYHTNVQIYQYDDKVWTRISGQIYLELQDVEWLGSVFLELIDRIRKGESLKDNAGAQAKLEEQKSTQVEALAAGVSAIGVSPDAE